MTTYSWKTGTSGDWNTGTNWSTGTVPNSGTADVVIDIAPTATVYTVTLAATESMTIDSLEINNTNPNLIGSNSTIYNAAIFELDGTLTFAPGSAGTIGGSLQTFIGMNAGTIVNVGTIYGFVQTQNNVLFTGTNGFYVTNWLQDEYGTTTVDTSSIAELIGNTLTDGIFEAKAGATIDLGGPLEHLNVSIATIEGPQGLPKGWTELYLDGPTAEIGQWNGTVYVPIETTLTEISGGGTLDILGGRNYTTANTLTINNLGSSVGQGLLNLQAGIVTTGGIDINGGIVQGYGTIVGAVVNNGTLIALGGTVSGTLDVAGSLTGTGGVEFDLDDKTGKPDTTQATLVLNSVSAGQTVTMNGGDTLVLATPSAFAGTIVAGVGNQIVLDGITATGAALNNGTLVVVDGTQTVASLALSGSYTGDRFATSAVAGGTDITVGVAPTFTAGASASYAAGGSAVTLDSGLTITDPDVATIIGATVALTAGLLSGDTLSGAAEAGITDTYDAATGVLTLSGSASVATYQAALDSVAYSFPVGDPTSQGTDTSRAVTWSINDGVSVTTATSSLSVSFTSNVKSDVLFQNDDGAVALWQVNGLAVSADGLVGPNPGPAWSLVGTGAFYTGDTADYVFQSQDGSVALWQVNGTSLNGNGMAADPGTAWQVKGTGDFYGDGNTDILFQNQDGSVALWDMSGSTIVQSGLVAANPGPTWQIKATGDFYGDGNTDIVFQSQDGSVALWDMQGTTIAQFGSVDASPGAAWRVVGTGDFYGDGHTDILFQNDDGSVAMWDMNGTTIVQSGEVDANPGPTWHVTGTGDFNNDGKTDIVFRNDNGAVAIWEMNGTSIVSAGLVANPGQSWNSVGNAPMQFIYSGAANETLTASTQVSDEFVFTDAAAGAHMIAGFNTNQDIIELSSAAFANFTAVQDASTASNGGTMINLGGSSSLFLSGVDPSTLHASNFALT